MIILKPIKVEHFAVKMSSC